MEASSESPLAVENLPPVGLAERAQRFNAYDFEDEEFPPDIPATWEWMLQPACHWASRRMLSLLIISLAVLLIAGSFFFVCWGPKLISPVLASPSSSSP